MVTPKELVGKTFDQIEFKKHHNILVMTIIKNKEEAIAARAAANIKYNFHENHGRKETKFNGC